MFDGTRGEARLLMAMSAGDAGTDDVSIFRTGEDYMTPRISSLKYGLLAAALFALSPAVPAQDDDAGFTEGQLESFMMARAEVRDIQSEYSSRLQDISDDQKVAELQAEAQEKMVQAVQSEGLTVEEFNEIARKANSDPEFNDRLQDLAE